MDLLDSLNISELLTLAQSIEPNSHRGLPRADLVSIALGNEHEKVPARKVDKIRLQIMQFIDANFLQVEPLVQSCPARTRNLRACFQCTDVQVMDCALNSPLIFQSPQPEPEAEETDMSNEIVTKTREEWIAVFQPGVDPAVKKVGADTLRAYGFQPSTYMSLGAEARADLIMGKQGPAEKEKPAGKTATKTKEAVTSAATGGGGGGGTDPRVISKLDELLAAVTQNTAIQIKNHNMLAVICLSDQNIKDNAESMDIALEILPSGND